MQTGPTEPENVMNSIEHVMDVCKARKKISKECGVLASTSSGMSCVLALDMY